MKKILLLIFGLMSFHMAQAQYDNWAVGFKLGEPTGLNVRKYFNNINAIDVTVGTFGGVIGNNRDYRQGEYRNVGLAVQAHYLWHVPFFGSDAVHVYYGLGGQINSRNYYADNRRNLPPPGDREKQISIGGSLLGGFEYYLPDGRYSAFIEGGTYVEVIPRPLFLSPNISLGVRLNL